MEDGSWGVSILEAHGKGCSNHRGAGRRSFWGPTPQDVPMVPEGPTTSQVFPEMPRAKRQVPGRWPGLCQSPCPTPPYLAS